jgi:hypothetical protein
MRCFIAIPFSAKRIPDFRLLFSEAKKPLLEEMLFFGFRNQGSGVRNQDDACEARISLCLK